MELLLLVVALSIDKYRFCVSSVDDVETMRNCLN